METTTQDSNRAAERLHRALGTLEALAREMCDGRDDFGMDVDVGNTVVRIVLRTGRLYDSKRLVGPRGANIAALSGLARMMFRGTGRSPDIGKVQTDAGGQEHGGPFKPSRDWPSERVRGLLKLAAESALSRRAEARIAARPGEPNASDALVEVQEVDGDALEFARHAAAVFSVIGVASGHRLFVDVTARKAATA